MSGYNHETGINELNWNKVAKYLEHRLLTRVGELTPFAIEALGGEARYATQADRNELGTRLPELAESLIRESAHTYLGKTPYGFKLVADDAQVWTLLSGKPATFGQSGTKPEEVYARWHAAREWCNATDLGKELDPPRSAVKVNRQLESLGYVSKKDGGWVPTDKALEENVVKERGGAEIYGNKPCVSLSLRLVDMLRGPLR